MNLLDQSIEPSTIHGLSDEQKARLTEILDQYLSSLDNGVPPSREALLLEHPDLAGPLGAYLDSLDELHSVAAGFAGAEASNEEAAAMPPPDEKRLGDFRLLREIGHGGMGVVYEAQQISLDRRVAVKVLPFAAVLDSKQIARFKNEAHAAAQLDHPNIVSVYAVGSDRGVHFFAMQFIDGQPLDRAIVELRERAKPGSGPSTSRAASSEERHESDSENGSTNRSFLTEISTDRSSYFRTVMKLGIQAAEALHAAHEYGVVHRDVKPSNLLLDGEGKLWVTDFGLARCQSENTLTQTGDLVGTMRYMSPEQTLGQSALVDQRTDIYSLGATLYELLSFEPAFPGQEGPDLLRRLAEQDPRPLKELQPRIPTDLQTVVHKAMARRREDRYTTAQEFADDLQRVLDGKPTIAKPPTLTDRLAKWARRHQRFVLSAAAVCFIAALGLATSTVLITRLKIRADQSTARATRFAREAQEAVERLGLDINEQLADVRGAAQVRKGLLSTTLEYYQGFVEDAEDDPALRVDLALTYEKIATLSEGIGSTDQAIESHEKAIALFKQLVHDDPGNPEYRARLARCHNNLGLLFARSGSTGAARHAYEEAIRLQSQLTTQSPGNSQYIGDLARSHCNFGLLQSETGDAAAAEASFLHAIRLQEQLIDVDADAPAHFLDLALSYNNLGTFYLGEQPDRAAELYEKALGYQRKAVDACPAELEYRSEVALTYHNLGAVRAQTGHLPQAADCYQHAIDIQRELVRTAPNERSYQRDLAFSFNNLGLVQSQLRRVAEADESFRQALALQEQLIASNPRDIDLSSSQGAIYNNVGIIAEGLNKLDDAGKLYRKAVEYQCRAYAGAPDVARYREYLSKHYYNYGRVMRRLGYPDEAARAALSRRELWPGDPIRLFSVVEELAQAGALMTDKQDGESMSEDCVAEALNTLESAIQAGYDPPANLADRDALAVLRGQQRFAELLDR